MSEIDPNHRGQIERWLGRSLTEDELRPVESLEALTNKHLEVVAAIRPHNLIAPVLYLNFVAPSASMAALTPFIDNIAETLATRRSEGREPRDWPNLALFERYAGRALSTDEKTSVPTLNDLAPAHIAMVAMLAHKEATVALLYLRRVVPSAATEACDAFVKELANGADSAPVL